MVKLLPSTIAAAFLAFASPAVADDANTATDTQRVIASQIAAFKANDGATAYSHAAPNVQRFFPNTEAFMSMVRSGYKPVYNPRNYTFGRFNSRDGKLFQEVLITGPQGKEWIALYTLERQADGSLKITSCQLAAHEVLAI